MSAIVQATSVIVVARATLLISRGPEFSCYRCGAPTLIGDTAYGHCRACLIAIGMTWPTP